jgi:broad specificity phosphatase PhoE
MENNLNNFKETKDQNLLVIRHLEDINDLSSGRDSSLERGQEAEVEKIAETIYSDFELSGAKAIFLNASSKKRAHETASLIKDAIVKKHPEAKVHVNPDDGLADLDHGVYKLPDGYKIRDHFQVFEDAWKIFTDETFNKQNIDYKFGESYVGLDGVEKYPDLSEVFMKPGESYREICIRLYGSILDFYENRERFEKGDIKLYAVTHSLPFGIFRSMIGLAQEYETGGLDFKKGELINLCWEYYNSGKLGRSTYGQISDVPGDILNNPGFMSILKAERDFLIENKK